jgi:hypothetical protein
MTSLLPKFKEIAKWLFYGNILILNVAIGFLFYKYLNEVKRLNESTVTTNYDNFVPTASPAVPSMEASQILQDYKTYVDQKYMEILDKVSTLSAGVKTTNVYITPKPSSKTTQVSYLPIVGNGSTLETDWVNVYGTDFYFDKKDFPGFKKAYFEANLKLFNGNGKAYARLYDVTHGVGVQGSGVETKSQLPELVVSGEVSLWEGKNLYRVQIKSLTADTAIYETGRLKIYTEN